MLNWCCKQSESYVELWILVVVELGVANNPIRISNSTFSNVLAVLLTCIVFAVPVSLPRHSGKRVSVIRSLLLGTGANSRCRVPVNKTVNSSNCSHGSVLTTSYVEATERCFLFKTIRAERCSQ